MRKNTVLAAFATLGLAAAASAQTYNGAGFAIPDNVAAGAQSSIVVTDAGTVAPGILVSLTFGATGGGATGEHTWAGDLIAMLSHNDGSTTVTATLFNRIGKTSATSGFGNANDLNGGPYNFTDSAGTSFWNATSTTGNVNLGTYRAVDNLYNGSQGPVVALDAIFAGRTLAGTWTLKLSDHAAGDTGGLASWSFTNVPAPGALALLGLAGLAGTRRRRG